MLPSRKVFSFDKHSVPTRPLSPGIIHSFPQLEIPIANSSMYLPGCCSTMTPGLMIVGEGVNVFRDDKARKAHLSILYLSRHVARGITSISNFADTMRRLLDRYKLKVDQTGSYRAQMVIRSKRIVTFICTRYNF